MTIHLVPHPNPFLPTTTPASSFYAYSHRNLLPPYIPPLVSSEEFENETFEPPPPQSFHNYLPNPSLICILLLIRSASGPQVVFHYPGGYKFGLGEDTDDGYGEDSDVEGRKEGSETDGTSSSSDTGSSGSSDDDGVEGDGEASSKRGNRERGSVSGKGSTVKTATRGSDRYGTGTGTGTGMYGRRRGRVDSDHETSESGSSSPTRPGSSSGLPHSSGGRHGGGSGGKPREGSMEWDSILGIDCASLAGILAPTKDPLLRTKFELGVNDWAWLGYPIGLLPGGKWRRSEEEKVSKVVLVDDQNRRVDPDDLSKQEMEDLMERMKAEMGVDGEEEKEEDGTTQETDEDGKPPVTEKKRKNPMSMFHVVFVLNPPILEHQQRVEQMFVNVVKPFSKALKWEQDRSGYVWKESAKILQLKDKAVQNGISFEKLWSNILEASDLARNIKTLYESITASQIAQINLNNNTRIPIQIPQLSQIPFLPTYNDPQMPGIPLSSACPYPVDDILRTEPRLHPTFTLLFLEDKESILEEIEYDTEASPEAKHLLYRFVEACKSTSTFEDVCRELRIDMSSVSRLANHFITNRKARAIPPLRPGDTYIVSPNADLRKVQIQAPIFRQYFREAPSLARMLSYLSGKPRMYSSIMAGERGPLYMDILEWLLRYGYATQLRTYGMVKVGGRVRKIVHDKHPELLDRDTGLGSKLVPLGESEQNEEEKLIIKRMVQLRRKAFRKLNGITEDSEGDTSSSDESSSKEANGETSEEKSENSSSETEGAHRKTRRSRDELSDSEISLHRYDSFPEPFPRLTFKTYDVDSSGNVHLIKTSPIRPPPPRPRSPSSSIPPPPALPPSIYIKNPSYPTLLEQEYLKELFENQSEEMKQYWDRCKRYFDGREALEKVSVKEVDLERKDVRRMVAFLKLLDTELGGVGIWRGW